MAYKTVVADRFFDSMISALRHVEADQGAFALAMLVPSYPEIGSWDVQLAAPWLEGRPSSQSSAKIRSELQRFLGIAGGKLGFVRIRSLQSQLVRTLVPLFEVPEWGTPYAVTSLEQTLFNLDEVIVLIARPELLTQEPMELSA